MGNPMAKNLMKHGYPLVLYDVFPDACREFQEAGEQVRLIFRFALDFGY
ncbi:3-hydroxyisobutyrate dehydrogenase, mitochondrial [Lemmus lemmus]